MRPSFNNISASISSISEAGYQVGTRIIVDVLDVTTTLYYRKWNLFQALYGYLISQLNLKSALGTLNEADLGTLNNTLGKIVPTDPQTVAPENATQEARTADSACRRHRPLHTAVRASDHREVYNCVKIPAVGGPCFIITVFPYSTVTSLGRSNY